MKIVLFGMPGSGKDTQANLLIKKYRIPHISTGEIFRQEMEKKSELGLKIDSIMKSGKFVDNATTIEVVKLKLGELNDFIFNGFPRNLEQAVWFDNYCKENNIQIDAYFFFDIDEQTARKRIETRYSEYRRPEDSSQESIKNRFDIYYNETLPCIKYFGNKIIPIQSKLQPNVINNIITTLLKG